MNRLGNGTQVSATAMLDALSVALRDVHKSLLEGEGKRVGVGDNPIPLLQLARTDERFSWLRPFSQLIADLDERRTDDEPPTLNTVTRYQKAVVARDTTRGEAAGEFYEHYIALMQQSPDIAMAHAALRRILGSIAPKGPTTGEEKGFDCRLPILSVRLSVMAL